MLRTNRLPEDATLVVRPDRRSTVLRQLPTITMFVVTTAVAAMGVAVTGSFGVWGVVGLLCLTGWVLEVLGLRADVMFGPVLAADDEHVWVRTGGTFRPASVCLDWSEVNAIAIRTWHGRRNASTRYLTFDLVEPVREALAGALDGTQDRRMRRLALTFGSPIAISEQRKDTSLDEVIRGLRKLAPEGVRFTKN